MKAGSYIQFQVNFHRDLAKEYRSDAVRKRAEADDLDRKANEYDRAASRWAAGTDLASADT